MADGHVNKCKECNKKDVRGNYSDKIQDPEWKLSERERHRIKSRKARKEGRVRPLSTEEKAEVFLRQKEKFPEKYKARILSQRIPLKPCEVCGSTTNIHRHHEDYSKPMDVTFLCVKHHNERHVEIRTQQLLNGTPNQDTRPFKPK
jgi:hypothetical protein